MLKYRMYIDEVGNSDLNSSDDPNHRFLSLTGVIFELSYVGEIVQPELESLKQRYFASHPDDPVILHRKEILNRTDAFHVLTDPTIRERFDDDLMKHLADWQYGLITVCLDKKNHKETYSTWRYDPYHYCLALLLERYVFFLESAKCSGDVMAESRGGGDDMRLKKSFNRLWTEGTQYIETKRIQAALTSCQLKVKPKSANIAGLQICDLVAHPSRNEILLECRMRSNQLPPFGARIANIIKQKYYQKDGKIFGRKFL